MLLFSQYSVFFIVVNLKESWQIFHSINVTFLNWCFSTINMVH